MRGQPALRLEFYDSLMLLYSLCINQGRIEEIFNSDGSFELPSYQVLFWIKESVLVIKYWQEWTPVKERNKRNSVFQVWILPCHSAWKGDTHTHTKKKKPKPTGEEWTASVILTTGGYCGDTTASYVSLPDYSFGLCIKNAFSIKLILWLIVWNKSKSLWANEGQRRPSKWFMRVKLGLDGSVLFW